ncbi:MAG: N-acetylmuramoyl-L-alanine amidase, partial [Microcoleaceae cyanobacterium]
MALFLIFSVKKLSNHKRELQQGKRKVKFYWLLPSLLGTCFLSQSAQAMVSATGLLDQYPEIRQEAKKSQALAINLNDQQIAVIKSIQVTADGNQLLISADQSLQYQGDWDSSSGAYKLQISGAKLGPRLVLPQFKNNDPIAWVRVRQEDAQTVVILVQPSRNMTVQQIGRPSQTQLVLQLQTARGTLPPRQQTRRTTLPVPNRTITPPSNTRRPSIPPTNTRPFPWPNRNPQPNTAPTPRGQLVVVLDAGHGGRDPGAIGIGGLQEKNVVMNITRQVSAILEGQGVRTVLTRTGDYEVELQPRVDMAERVNGAVFVSIHANSISMSRPDVNGIETYYYNSGLGLAQTIHANLLQGTGANDRRVRQARFYVLRNTSMPAVLLEVGFVT